MKVLTFVGTRPELIKLARTLAELDRCFEHVLIHTGQNFDYELNAVFFEQLGIRRPDRLLETAGETSAQTIANVIAASDRVLREEQPDAVLILGDTNSAYAALAAKRLQIPVFHMEAGNRCFDERVPEEINRRIIDHVSDINLPYTEHARRYLLAEGKRPETIIKTGSPMTEVLHYYRDHISRSTILRDLSVERNRYFVVSAHREENVDRPERLRQLLESLDALVESYDFPVIVSTHPRTRNRLNELDAGEGRGAVRFLPPLGFLDYVHLQQHSACVISDSGTVTEESAILGFPAVTIRDTHERPEGMDEATLVMCGVAPADVLTAVRLAIAHHDGADARLERPADYAATNVSVKIARIIASYTGYVNRTVWLK